MKMLSDQHKKKVNFKKRGSLLKIKGEPGSSRGFIVLIYIANMETKMNHCSNYSKISDQPQKKSKTKI